MLKNSKKFIEFIYEHQLSLKYFIVFIIILISNLVWFNFSKPPISANTGFPINMFRIIKYYYLPFNFYSWPVSLNPMVIFFPGSFPYFILNVITSGDYSLSFFIYNVGFEIAGGFSLFFLASKFLSKYGIKNNYAMISIIIYAFNVSLVLDGAPFETGTAQLLIIIAIFYLILYRSKIYLLLLGFVSFFIFFPFPGGYPAGAVILLEEYLLISLIFILNEYVHQARPKIKKILPVIKLAFVSIGVIALSVSYILFIVLASNSTLLANSVSLHPVYVFGFIYDWIAVLPNSIRLILNWGVYTIYAGPWVASYIANPVISILLYILPFFSTSSILFLRRKDYYIYIILIISIFAATTSNPPFGKIFETLVLYVGPLRPFYGSDAYYPILVILYSLLFPLTLYNFSVIIKKLGKKHDYSFSLTVCKNKSSGVKCKNSPLKFHLDKIFTVTIILILIGSVYPIYTGLVDQSGSATPVESSIPNYYFQASDFLDSMGQNSPVMVFPGIYGFSAYETGGKIWYQGINLYPELIENPSISDALSHSYTVGRGDAYNVIDYVYGHTMSTTYGSTQNDSNITLSENYVGDNSTSPIWVANYPTDSLKYEKLNSNSSMIYLDYNINWTFNKYIGSHDLIGTFKHPININEYNYVILEMKTEVATSSLSLGFFNSSGDFFYWVGLNDFLPTIIPKSTSVIPVYLNSNEIFQKQKIQGIALSYNRQSGDPLNFSIYLYSLKFAKSSINMANIISRGLNILGIKYAYVDTGIVNGFGIYNGPGYNSIFENSSFFRLIYRNDTISIYSYKGYMGLVEAYSNVYNYPFESYLLGNLFYNISQNSMPLYGLNIKDFKGSSNSRILDVREVSPTEYIVIVNYKGPFAIFFKEVFSPNWVALSASGGIIKNHFEADGYGNGWIISNNTSVIKIVYKGALLYSISVTITVLIPFLMLASFIVIFIKHKKN